MFVYDVVLVQCKKNYQIWRCSQHTRCTCCFTSVALAKAGLINSASTSSVRPSVGSFVRPFVCPSATLLGCLVCVICNSKSFHFFLFKLCIMIIHTLNMCLPFLCKFDKHFLIFRAVELRHFFPSEMLRGCLVCVICSSSSIQTLYYDCSHIEHVHPIFTHI